MAVEQIDLFAAMKQGQVDVEFIPQDEKPLPAAGDQQDRPALSVKLPDSFAGVPVLAAQMGNFPFGGNGPMGGNLNGPGGNNPFPGLNGNNQSPMMNSSSSNSKTPQRIGGGGPGTTGPGQNGRNGFFNVAPEATQKVKLETVCLDYGHPSPRAAMKYNSPPGRRYGQGGRRRTLRVARPAGDRPSHRATGRLALEQRHELGEARRIADEAGDRHDPRVHERRNRRGEENGREGRRLAQAAAGGRQADLRRRGEVSCELREPAIHSL